MQVRCSSIHFAALGVMFLLAGAAPTQAQTIRNPSQSEMQAREWALTHVPDEVNKHFKKEQISLFAQIREDFTRLQLVNNEMMQTVFVKGNVDPKLIASSIAEINKRAVRLKENLALPKIEDQTKEQKPNERRSDSSLQVRLLALDRCIMSFVTNALFKETKVLDSHDALRAKSDLNLIIQLSKGLKASLDNARTAP